MAEELSTKQFVDRKTGRPISNPVYIGDVYDRDGDDAVMRLFGQCRVRDTYGQVGDYRFTDDDTLAPNHLWADGSPIDPLAWPELAAYGARMGWKVDGTTGRRCLPDLRGRFLVGVDAADPDFAPGMEGGEKKHTLTKAELPKERITLTLDGQSIYGTEGGSGSGRLVSLDKITTATGGSYYATANLGNSEAHNNLPPYRAVRVQIRAKADPVIAKSTDADTLGGVGPDGYASADQGEKADLLAAGAVFSVSQAVPTGERYLDGKPIYRQFLEISSLPNNGDMAYRFYTADTAWLDAANSWVQLAQGKCPLPYVNIDTGSQVMVYPAQSGVTVSAKGDWSQNRAVIAVKFTQ